MRIGALEKWNVLEAKESLNFPGPGRAIVLEVMAIAAEVTISDGLIAYPIGIINGYERLEFRTHGPIEVIVENGAMSYKTNDLVEIGQYLVNEDEAVTDASFASPFQRHDDGIDPAIKQLIFRSNQLARERERFLIGEMNELRKHAETIGRGAAGAAAPSVAGEEGAVKPADTSGGGEGKPDAAGMAGAGGAPKSQGKSEGDAKPGKGEQPPA